MAEEVKNEKPTEMITVSVSEFEALKAKIEMLTEVADKGRLANWQSKHLDFKLHKVMVNTLNGVIINGWKTVKNEVGKNPTTGLWFEDQQNEYHFVDESKPQTLRLIDANRLIQKVSAEIVKRTSITDENGQHDILTVDVAGTQYDIDAQFVN